MTQLTVANFSQEMQRRKNERLAAVESWQNALEEDYTELAEVYALYCMGRVTLRQSHNLLGFPEGTPWEHNPFATLMGD